MKTKTYIIQLFCTALLLYLLVPEFVTAQHVIGQEVVDKVTQRVENGKEGREASFMMDTEDLKPGEFYLFRLSIRGEYKPELEVRFDKTSYEEGDEITMTVERKTANRMIYPHLRTGEEIDEGVYWEKLPVWSLAGMEIKGKTPDENGTVWLEVGESFTAKTVFEKARASDLSGDTFHITLAAGNVNSGESREYILVRKEQATSGRKNKHKDPVENNQDDPQMMQSFIPSSLSIGCFPSIQKPSGGTNAARMFTNPGSEINPGAPSITMSSVKGNYSKEAKMVSFTVNGGAFLYHDEEFTNANQPVEHAVLTVFESNNQSKLDDINALADENDFDIIRTDYAISTNFNGEYSIYVSTSRDYFKLVPYVSLGMPAGTSRSQ
jgi:hypothetical protein